MSPRSLLARAGCMLALVLLLLGAGAGDPAQELQVLEKQFQQELQEMRRASKEAGAGSATADEVQDAFRRRVVPDFAARFAALARAHEGTDTAFSAWLQVLALVPKGLEGELPLEALRALSTRHVDDEALADVAMKLPYATSVIPEAHVIAALRAIAGGSPHRKVQASALFSLASLLGQDRPAGDPRIDEARAVIAKLAGYADVERFAEHSYAAAAEKLLFALDHLAVGKRCPDFEAVDAEGVAFKLSDYAGKVVLIDFWGFW